MGYNIQHEAKRFYDSAQTHHQRWKLGRDVLYQMCQGTRHDDLDATMSKLWLIGRSHSVALERTHTPVGGTYKTYQKTATKMAARGTLDRMLDVVANAGPRNSLATLQATHDVVEHLEGVLHASTGQRKTSLASKYLHFHLPAIPILDSIAEAALKQLVPKKAMDEKYKALPATRYGRHLARYAQTFDAAAEAGFSPTARTLDNFLLSWWVS